jgi:hypothetical protein
MINNYPSPLTMLEAFGIEPKTSIPEDGFWEYEFFDENEVGLNLSFNIYGGSIQTALSLNNIVVEIVSCEGEGVLIVEKVNNMYMIRGELRTLNAKTTLTVNIFPYIFVNWSSVLVA